MKNTILCIIFSFLAVLFSAPYPSIAEKVVLTGKSKGMRFQVEQVIQGLEIPWGLAFLNPYEIIFTQRNGAIGVLSVPTRKVTILKGDIPRVHHAGQGGMLDVAVPENYASEGLIYFTYSKPVRGKGATTLARAKLKNDMIADWQDLLITRSATKENRHFGSRIAFDNNGHIYFTVGDRGIRPSAQDLTSHAGSILRLNLDGSIPDDNPFLKQKKVLPEIYSFGHRNPQGIIFDTVHNRLWAIEHGPRGGDEINLVLPGKNYGWPVISYGKEYWGPVQVGEGTRKKGMEQPVKYYVPSIAPGSLILYSGKAFPKWKGNLISGALKLEHLNRVVLDAAGRAVSEERLIEDLGKRIRAVVESPEGWIYFSTDYGQIFRLRPVPGKTSES